MRISIYLIHKQAAVPNEKSHYALETFCSPEKTKVSCDWWTTILISDWFPRVLTEEEQMQIKTFHKWQMKVSKKLRTTIHYME